MSKMSVFVKGTVIAAVVALAFSSVAFAKGRTEKVPAAPATAASSSQANTQLLQNSWKTEMAWLKFDNAVLSHVEKVLDSILTRLDKVVRSKRPSDRFAGKFGVTLRDVQALLAKAQAIVAAHAGFDANGAVTDQAQALKSVQALGADLNALRGTLIHRLEHL